MTKWRYESRVTPKGDTVSEKVFYTRDGKQFLNEEDAIDHEYGRTKTVKPNIPSSSVAVEGKTTDKWGNIYEGYMVDGIMHGKGREINGKDGSTVYEGD